MKFRNLKLGELCDFVTDYVANGSFKTLAENVKYQSSGYARVIRLVDFNNHYSLKDSIWVSEEAYHFLAKSKLFGKEIILTNVGANLGTVFQAPNLDFPMTLGPNAMMMKSKENDQYLYYWLKSRAGQNAIKSIVTGSAMPKFNKTDFKNLIIPIPSIEEQEKIVSILEKLDHKITLNNQVNEKLLEIINCFYKDTFESIENFDKAENIANITIGKTPPRKEKECFTHNENDMKWISISDLGKSGTYILNTAERLTMDSVNKYHVKVIPEDTILLSFKLTIGRIGITTENMTTNEAIAHFNLKDKDMKYYLYSYLKNFDYAKLGNTSSIATAVNSKMIKAISIGIPSKEMLKEYNSKVQGMFKKILKNEKENQNLEQLRNILLPKIMNGEIELR